MPTNPLPANSNEPEGEPDPKPEAGSGPQAEWDQKLPPEPPTNSNQPEDKPDSKPGVGSGPQAEWDQKPPPEQPEPDYSGRREGMEGLLHNVFDKTFMRMKTVMQNLPDAHRYRKIPHQEGVLNEALPSIYDGVDSYFRNILAVLDANPDVTPGPVQKENIKHAFLALRLVQTQLNDMVEIHGEKRVGSGLTHEPARYVDQHERMQGATTALNIGARMDGKKARSPELDDTEKLALKDLVRDISIYSVAVSHLLGITLTGFRMVSDEEHRTFKMERPDISAILGVSPPSAWAEEMKKFTIKVPTKEAPQFTVS